MPNPNEPASFEEVLRYELEAVRLRRSEVSDTGEPKPVPDTDDIEKLRKAALNDGMVGLALSGGGVRSATFCLGFLQGLARLNLLTTVDYLSTVSGGGFIGGWLTAWIHREEQHLGAGATANVEKQLAPDRKTVARAERRVCVEGREGTIAEVLDDEPEPVYHLRAYSNYLAPRPAWFSGDMWTIYAIYARNTFVNLLILVPAVFAAVLLAFGLVWVFAQPGGWWGAGAAAVVAGTAVVALCQIRTSLSELDDVEQGHSLLYSLVNQPPMRWLFKKLGITVSERPVKWRFYGDIVFLVVCEAVAVTWLFTTAPTPTAPAAETPPAAESTWDVTLKAQPADETGALMIGPLKAHVKRDAPPPAPPAPEWGSGAMRFPGYALIPGEYQKWFASWAVFFLFFVAIGGVAGLVRARRGKPAANLILTAGLAKALKNHAQAKRATAANFLRSAGLGLLCGALCFVPFALAMSRCQAYPAAVATLGPPLFLLALAAAGFVEAAVHSRGHTAHEREWRARLAATLALVAVTWLAFFGTVFFLPAAVRGLLLDDPSDMDTVLAIAGWVATTVGGLLAANSARTSGDGGRKPSRILGWLAAVGPVVFLAGLLALLGVLAGWGLDGRFAEHRVFDAQKPADWPALVAVGVGVLLCGGFAYWLSNQTDVNVFSMHALYSNRLVRGYLGASRRKVYATDDPDGGRIRKVDRRWDWIWGRLGGAPTGVGEPRRRDNPITGFDSDDDVALQELQFRPAAGGAAGLTYTGPYHLLGTALNLRAGDELAVQDRRAASFVLSPGYCGSDKTGYEKTPAPKGTGAPNLTLGRAMTISGAAADPNMSSHQSPAVTALMTVFNVRLGWWMQNPRSTAERGETWEAGAPANGMLSSLVRELFGLTHDRGEYVHLSDGGHFDNTGVYELVRRRCRFIIQVDAAADPDDLYEDLAQLVRRVRADFGIRIELDPTPTRRGADRLSKCHVAVGRIRYDDIDADALAGTLVYVRPTRNGDEPVDVRQYADTHPSFPHTPTLGDQFFDNDQFEAYRMLGEHAAGDVFEDAVQLAPRWPVAKGARAGDYRRGVRSLFAEVHGRWYPPPVGIEAAFQQAGQDCAGLMSQFRDDHQLAGFVRGMYPELPLGKPDPALSDEDRRRELASPTRSAELLAVNQLLDVMERAWHGVRLASHYDHPINRGWMNAFRRWTSSPAFHRAWPVIRGEYGKDFVRFCERALNLPAYRAEPVPYDPVAHDEQVKGLGEDFAREWGNRLGRVKERTDQQAGAGARAPAADVTPFFDRYDKDHLWHLARAAGQPAPYAGAWLLYLADIRPDGKSHVVASLGDHPVGLLAVVPRGRWGGKSHYEVVFWVRPAYRSLGLGRSAVEYSGGPGDKPLYKRVLDGIRSANLGNAVRVWSHYPSDLSTRGDRPQRSLWLNFCHDYDFRRHDQPNAGAGAEPLWVSVKYDVP